MTAQYDVLVFIGRLEPPHIGHFQVLRKAFQLSEQVVILLGSCFQPRTTKNPWTFAEREGMIRSGLTPWENECLEVRPLRDIKYNDARWVQQVQDTVAGIVEVWNKQRGEGPVRIGIIGHNKDESSYYLKMFPQWGEPIDHPMADVLNAADLREIYFGGKNLKFLKSVVPASTYMFLEQFQNTPDYVRLVKEWEFIQKHDAAWAVAPYPPSFMAVDSVVTQSGHVLLIRRKSAPGEGLAALPGGYVNQNEWTQAAMIRELREECRIKVPEPVLIGSIKSRHLFEDPNRSERKRMYSMGYHIDLPPGPLPKVRGGDDANKAFWLPLNDLDGEQMFEDHLSIIQYFTGV